MTKPIGSTVAGIDLGTQSIKVVVYDPENKSVLAERSQPLDLIARDDGTREQEAHWFIEGLKHCFTDIPESLKQTISAIGVSGQQHGFIPLDESGKALYRVKLWCDTSTTAECAELTRAAGGEGALISKIGNLMLPGYTAPKILWLKKNEPRAFAALRHVLLPHDYLNLFLTGEYTAEYGDASGTALFDVRTRTWSRDIADLIDPKVYDCLPRLLRPEEPAGFVTAASAKALGILPGIPVSSGGGDNMMGAIGTGTVKDGFLTMSLGTSGTLYGYSAIPIVDEAGNVAAFCSSTGGWLPLVCTMNCTVATEKVREIFGLNLTELQTAAELAPIGSSGVVTLPFYGGERTPNLPRATAGILGLTATNCTRENIARSAMEGAIFGLRGGLDAFRSLSFNAQEIRLIGGGAKSPLWRTIAANVMGLPVSVPSRSEGAAFGAALQALFCFTRLNGSTRSIEDITDAHVAMDDKSTVSPDREAVKRYDDAYENYKQYLGALRPLYS